MAAQGAGAKQHPAKLTSYRRAFIASISLHGRGADRDRRDVSLGWQPWQRRYCGHVGQGKALQAFFKGARTNLARRILIPGREIAANVLQTAAKNPAETEIVPFGGAAPRFR